MLVENKHGRAYLFFLITAIWLSLMLISCGSNISATNTYTYTVNDNIATEIVWASTGSILYGTDSGGVITRESDTGEQISSFDIGSDEIIDLGLSPENSMLAILSNNSVVVRDITLDQSLWQYDSPEAPISSMAWSPDRKWLALGLDNGSVNLLETQTGSSELTLTGLSEPVVELAWSQDGAKLVGSANLIPTFDTIIWDTSDGSVLETSLGIGTILDSAWIEGQPLIAFTFDDNTQMFFLLENAETDETEKTFWGSSSDIVDLAWSPDGSMIAAQSTDGSVSLWKASKGRRMFTIEDADAMRLSWSSDSSQLLVLSANGTITIWQINP